MSFFRSNSVNSPAPRRFKKLLLALLVFGAGLYGLNRWVTGKIESAVIERLGERDLSLNWRATSWTPWDGMRFRNLEIRRKTGDLGIIASSTGLSVHLPISQYFNGGKRKTYWTMDHSDVVLADVEGPVGLTDVSMRLTIQDGTIEVSKLLTAHNGLQADLKGKILTRKSSTPKSGPFELRLSGLRSTLAVLDFRGDELFHAKGTFEVDARKPEVAWNSDLNGSGKDIDWKGTKLSSATAAAKISSEATSISASVSVGKSSSQAVISRQVWGQSPIQFEGIIRDAAGLEDPFSGDFEDGVFTIKSLRGKANLWDIAKDSFRENIALPDNITFRSFPMIEARDIRWTTKPENQWTVGNVAVSAADLTVRIKEREITAGKLSGNASYDGKSWEFSDATSRVFGGTIFASGKYQSARLSGASIQADGLRMADLKRLGSGGGEKPGKGILYLTYQGSIGFQGMDVVGKGKMRLEDAPVFDVPLLDEVYKLFASIIPGIESSGDGRFDADFTAKSDMVQVNRFEAKGGTLTVSAIGTVDLEKKWVSGKARGKLLGVPGIVTSPLGRLLEMDVAGPYDKIRVKPLGPAKLVSNAASGTVGVAVDTIEETGRITGTILKEGIKVPFGFLKGEKQQDASAKDGKTEVKRPPHRR